MLQIPVTVTGNSSVDITLDGVTFRILTKYNTRNERLYVSLYRGTTPVLLNVKMVEGLSITNGYAFKLLPKGVMDVLQFNIAEKTPTLGNTGINLDYSLVYIPTADVDRG